MKRKLFVLAAILAVALMAAPAAAFTLTAGGGPSAPVTDSNGSTAVFNLEAGGLLLDITITDGLATTKLADILSSLFWTGAPLAPTTASTAFAPHGLIDPTQAAQFVSSRWAYASGANGFAGNQGVSVMELGYFLGGALDGTGGNTINGSNYSLVHGTAFAGGGANINFVLDEVDIVLHLPSALASYDITDVTFHYGTEAIPGVPIPASALLLGSGLLGLVGLGWRRKQS